MVSFPEYLKGVLSQVLDSYQILLELKDKPGELEIIKKELLKINGLLQVTINKIEAAEKNSDDYVRYLKSSKFYLENYDFEREIEIMAPLYSEDPHRIKNIRLKIIDSLKDKKLLVRIQALIQSL